MKKAGADSQNPSMETCGPRAAFPFMLFIRTTSVPPDNLRLQSRSGQAIKQEVRLWNSTHFCLDATAALGLFFIALWGRLCLIGTCF